MARWGSQLGCALALWAACAPAAGQTIRFPSSSAPPASPGITIPPAGGVITSPSFGAPPAAAPNPYGGAGFGAAPFDPYSSSGSSAYQFWGQTPPATTPGAFAQPPASPYGATTPLTSPYAAPSPLGAPPGSFPTYGPPPPSPYPAANPQYVFPGGIAPAPGWDLSQSIRFIQDVRLRHTWLDGSDDDNDLDINDSETAVTFTLPNFLTTGQPLYISPAFALHLWDGPASMPADLPPQAYSAYLDFQWASDPNLQLGAELGFRVGAYTDFNTLNDDSLRIQGLALGVARLTPNLTFKIGAMYLDRNKVKILPAGGFLWTPSPQVRFDIFFPQPKLSGYLTTIGRYELWWYVAGEYGGGAWTIERTDASTDHIDINDIRFSSGLEWTGPRGFTGFIESGYVFEREVIYVVDPSDSFDPDDTFMLRAGFSW